VTVDTPLQLHRFTLDEYHRMAEAGIGEDIRVELIDGLIVDMSPKSREHDDAIEWLTEWLFSSVDRERYGIRVQSAITLETSEPEPDLVVVPRDAPRPYHPGTAALVIEVTLSSHDRDLRQKPRMYGCAGVSEYWVVDLQRRRIVVHREPGGGRYRVVTEIAADGTVAAEGLTLPALDVAELLAAAGV
jgi:Uma2 family endonuclease